MPLAVAILLFAIYQIYALIHLVEQTNRDLVHFFQAIHSNDFSQTFSAKQSSKSFRALHEALGGMMARFRELRREKEEQNRYLQTVIQHVGIGILAFRADGEIELLNKAAKRLLLLNHLKNIGGLKKHLPLLYDALIRLKRGEKRLLKIIKSDVVFQLVIYATDFLIAGNNIRLVTLQDIQAELDEKEMEAWQNLIRVLTHEIMNSITPISSLAATAFSLLPEDKIEVFDVENLHDIRQSLSAIEKRSSALLHFVESYRSLSRIPVPSFKIVSMQQVFLQIEALYRESCTGASIELATSVEPESLEITADPELLEQVLINLVLNAKQALQGRKDGKIELLASLAGGGRIQLEIADNGPGIAEENLEKIFIPFFTTKKSGSGIGLSLARQIMRLHRGTISVHSTAQGAVFRLQF